MSTPVYFFLHGSPLGARFSVPERRETFRGPQKQILTNLHLKTETGDIKNMWVKVNSSVKQKVWSFATAFQETGSSPREKYRTLSPEAV